MENTHGGDDVPLEKEPKKRTLLPKIYIYLIVIVVLIVLFAYIFLNPFFVDLEGKPAPDFSVEDIDGNDFTLSEHAGKVVILDIMSLSCSVCIKEMEHLRAIFSRYNSDEVVIATISIDGKDSNEELSTLRSQHGGNWTFARDNDGVANKYKVSYIPTIVIIDKEGVIRYWDAGEISAPRLSSEINKWL